MKNVWFQIQFICNLLLFRYLPIFSQNGCLTYLPQHQEKVYLHFDQTAYFLKETIWFNAYILDESNRPTDISRVLYVELVSPEGGIVDTFKGKIENGTCHGQFALDSAYLSGYFEIRAYTRHMMNFGEDNYFSRVFPIYDIATDGNYHIRSMLDRLRPDLSKDNNLTFRERKEKARKPSKDTLPLSVQKAVNSVIRHYNYFTPDTIACESIPKDLRPGEKVELVFRATPYSQFSLSVCAEESFIHTHNKGDIYQTLFKDYSWVERSYQALQNFNPQKDIRYAPEKGITVDGDFILNKRRKIRFLPQATISLSIRTDSLHFGGNTKTDSCGYWAFTMDDFYGKRTGSLNAIRADFFWNESRIRMHKWFSPPPRQYQDNEYHHIQDYTIKTDSLTGTAEVGIKQLKEVKVTAQQHKRTWKGTTRSLVHYSYAEEQEYALDQTGTINFDGSYPTWKVVSSLLSRYYYPERYTRLLITNHYHGDYGIPEGHIHDGNLKQTDNIKEIVVRTDRATCLQYDYSRVPFQHHIEKNPTGTITIAHKYKSLGIPSEDNPYSIRAGLLNYLVCLIPYSSEEQIAKKLQPTIRLSPTSRATIIKGFSRPKELHQPKYNCSLKELDADFRRTLYWNPSVKTDAQGFARITFYNNNNCRSLHISAEGIGADGNPIIYYNKEKQK
ncbi:hypothetical protein [Paraprevotella xylaniphila]|uniref:hypothetical protein n=1 Tax=Paraprevotella xylaniphila TaxID=454155 RepID=UPI003FD74572